MRVLRSGVGAFVIAFATTCTYAPAVKVNLDGQQVRVTFLHTADWHSRLLPYNLIVGELDKRLGLDGGKAPFGGVARVATLLKRERARATRVLHVDTGDSFQGAPIFNLFNGAVELRMMSEVGIDVGAIGNHEFDKGARNFAEQAMQNATFPLLAANYLLEDPRDPGNSQLGAVAKPYTVFNLQGLRVGVIGMGNLSSLTSLFDTPNRIGATPLDTVQVAQFYIDLLRPMVDLVVFVTHLGLRDDERMIQGTTGIDIVFGGHLHVVLNPPKVVFDCQDDPFSPDDAFDTHRCAEDGRKPRPVLLVHSGAFMKFLGRLDVVADQQVEKQYDPDAAPNDWGIASHRFQLFPVDSSVAEDPRIAWLMEPYVLALDRLQNLDVLVGFAPRQLGRFGSGGGDSALGNVVATSMLLRFGVETDFVVINTSGFRTDVAPGPVTLEDMFNVFPFDNTITTMFLTGSQVEELFNFVARRTTERGCRSQAQIAGARVTLNCGDCYPSDAERDACATRVAFNCAFDADGEEVEGSCDELVHCERPDPDGDVECENRHPTTSYSMAANNYIARGGSGFRVLARNATQVDTGLPQRDVAVDFMRNAAPCAVDPATREARPCRADADCAGIVGGVCSCTSRSRWNAATGVCDRNPGASCEDDGVCVLDACVAGVATYDARACRDIAGAAERERCEANACANAGEQCKFLACLDEHASAAEDGRVRVVSQ